MKFERYAPPLSKAGIAFKLARVAIGAAKDRVAPVKARRAEDCPASVAQITPEWLTAVLCAPEGKGRVLGFSFTGGDAGSSTRQGLALELDDDARAAGVPERIFTKSAPSFIQRAFLGLSQAAVGEMRFYRMIRPYVEIEAPKGLHACLDPGSWRTVTVMDDIVHDKGARFLSTEIHISKEMMSDLLGNLAKLHAHFWQSPRLTGDLASVRTTLRFLEDMSRLIAFKDRAFQAMNDYLDLLPPGMNAKQEELYAATLRSYQGDLANPATILHGDAHIAQAYRTAAGRMGWSDWQLVQRGSWAADFAYAIGSSLTIEDRRAWERELLARYLDDLAAAGGPTLDIDDAWDEYRRHTLYPFFAWAFTRAGAGSRMPDMQPDQRCDDIMTRTAHMVWDLDALAAFA